MKQADKPVVKVMTRKIRRNIERRQNGGLTLSQRKRRAQAREKTAAGGTLRRLAAKVKNWLLRRQRRPPTPRRLEI